MANQTSGSGQYDVVWPSGERRMAVSPLARRLDTLNGKTVAQLWDFLFAGDEIFAALEEELARTYPDVKWVSWREFGSNSCGQREGAAGLAAAAFQGSGSRRRHLVHGLLRLMHARRAAGCGSLREGRFSDVIAGM